MLTTRSGTTRKAERLRIAFALSMMMTTATIRVRFGIRLVISLVNISLSDETSFIRRLRIFPVGLESK